MKLLEEYLQVIQEDNISEFFILGIAAAVVAIKKYLSDAAKKCRKSKGKLKSICILKNEIIAYKKLVSVLKKEIPNCKNEKCKISLRKKISKINEKIKKNENKLREITAEKGS